MNLISINTPVIVVNTGNNKVDGLIGKIVAIETIIRSSMEYTVNYTITLDKPLDDFWVNIGIPNTFVERIN